MSPNATDVFVSHSSRDEPYAEVLAGFLCETIDFEPGEVVCTSAVGYGLEFGTKFERQLRKCIEASEVVVPIISRNSLSSVFCVFEMGAAWGQKIPIMPILVPEFEPSELPRPISSLQYFLWTNESAWIQFVSVVARITHSDVRVKPARVAVLAKRIAAHRAA